ncbi:MAG TPA: hypothetical protein VHN20_05400 [Beijerinckiaceae bacterium]|nr:hypothetical protein [Beijerinckiaceae bacterium]
MADLRNGVSTVSGLTASTTQTQAGANALDPGILSHRVTTVASAGDAVRLPPAKEGRVLFVVNAAAANAMGVFPASNDAINALAADAVYSVAANKAVVFVCTNAGRWHTILTA